MRLVGRKRLSTAHHPITPATLVSRSRNIPYFLAHCSIRPGKGICKFNVTKSTVWLYADVFGMIPRRYTRLGCCEDLPDSIRLLYNRTAVCLEEIRARVILDLRHRHLARSISVFKAGNFGSIHNSLGILDLYRGVMPRWEVTFNITMLRMLSFGMDYYWALRQPQQPVRTLMDMTEERTRIDTPCPPSFYGVSYFFAYALYTPLYIAGPIITFNNFIHQILFPLQSISPKMIIKNGLRLAFCILTLEFVLHSSRRQRYLDRTCLERIHCIPIEHDWVLEFDDGLVKRYSCISYDRGRLENDLTKRSNSCSLYGDCRDSGRSQTRWMLRKI